jgi:hypothetical protein
MHRRIASGCTFLLHQIISTIGVIVVASFLTFGILPQAKAHWILTETHYFPVQIGLAFFIGFVNRRYRGHAVMEWVWVLPSLILCVSLVLTPLPLTESLSRHFGRACKPEFRCFVQLAVTLPFYTAISYSVAALLSRTTHKDMQQRETPE